MAAVTINQCSYKIWLNAGNSENPTVLDVNLFMNSDNQFGADNQQERLISNNENPQRLHAKLKFCLR